MAANEKWWEVTLRVPCHQDALAGRAMRWSFPKAVALALIERYPGQTLRLKFRNTAAGFAQDVIPGGAAPTNEVAVLPWPADLLDGAQR